MAQQVFGPAAVVSVLNRAFTNTSPSNAVFNNQVATAGVTDASQLAFAQSFGAPFATGKTAAELSAMVMMNLGLDNEALATALTDYITANGTQNIGIIAYQLASILSGLENDATYGAAAKAWNAEVTGAYEYSSNPKNTTASSGSTNGNEAPSSTVLTTGQDILTGGAGADNFRGVAGQPVGNQEQSTFNSSDIIDGGAGQDALILNLVGNYNGGARVKGIETLTLGTNVAAAVNVFSSVFDFNVNQGFNEISDVQTIEYDQIDAGEALQVRNIVKTAGADGTELATLLWDNEAGTTAGTIDATYRSSAVTGATVQKVILDDVAASNVNFNSGRLNFGSGVETLSIDSGGANGTTTNTLNNSFNFDGRAADLVSGSADGVNDNGALTKVIVTGAQAFGRAAGVVTGDTVGEANFGLTNRALANGDVGLTNTVASASNLISVAGTVTEIDATAADGGVAMRFVGRADNGAVNVTFKGGKAIDYIEFERGNINASGGEGADTFAFINNALTSYDFGSADTIVGGVGVDTIQLGVNGVGSVVANTTEFNNKTGIDVLDLRGNVNNVTLADAFVAAADAGTFTVRTDKIVQTSGEVAANATPSLANNNRAAEDNSVNTIVLTELADNRAIKFIGGSGKDQVVVDNASANQFTELDGGSNTGTAATGTLGFNDSLTVVNTSVLDDNDVKNIKNFEFVNLVETIVGNSSFNLSLSEQFVLANANGLVIGSTTGTFGQRLNAGDVVNLEVSDLQTAANSGVLKASLAARTINVTDLLNAGVTVNYQVNGVTVSSGAAVPAFLVGRIVTNVAPDATILDDVAGAVAGGGAAGVIGAATIGTLAAGGVVMGTAASENYNATVAVAAATTLDAAGGVDSVTLTNAGAVAVAATITNVETLVLAAGGNAVTFAGTGFSNVVGGAGTDDVTLDTTVGAPLFVAGGNVSLGGSGDTLRIVGAAAVNKLAGSVLDGGAGDDVIIISIGAVDLSTATITGFEQLQTGGQAVTLTAAQFSGFSAGTTGNGAITLATAGAVNVGLLNAGTTYNLSQFGNSITVSSLNAQTINGNIGNDTIIGGSAADTITGGNGVDVLTGGLGADTFAFGVSGSGTTVGALDRITDFNTGGADKLTFGANTVVLAADATALVAGSGAGANVQTSAGGVVTFAAADSTLALKIAAVQADVQLDAANSVAYFVDGANGYIYYAGAAVGNADDQFIELTGMASLITITGGATTVLV